MKGFLTINFSLLLVSLFLLSCSSDNNSLPNSDETLPTVIKALPETPPVGQTVLVSEQISVTFSEAMDKQSVENGFIVEPNNGGTINYEPSLRTATFRPASGTSLQGDTDYTVTLQNTIKDTANNFLVEQNWTFTTEDNVPPKLLTCIPKCDGTPNLGVTAGLSIYLIFDEDMFESSFNDFTVIIKNLITGNAVTGGTFVIVDKVNEPNKVRWSAALNASPENTIEENTDYIVTIKTGIQDNSPAHNPLDIEKVFTFTTEAAPKDTFSPIIKSATPVGGTKNVAHDSVISVTFINSNGTPEKMNFNSIGLIINGISNFSVTNELGHPVEGVFSNNSLDTVVFTPTSPLNLLDTYTVTLKNLATILDAAGNSLAPNGNDTEIVLSTFYTGDGKLGSTAIPFGVGLAVHSFYIKAAVHLTTKKDGSVHAVWLKNNAAATKKLIMSRIYRPSATGGAWDPNPTDITSNIVTATFDTIGHSAREISALVTDSNDNHMLVWRNIDNILPSDHSSIIVSKWSEVANGTETWVAPEMIHQGSETQSIDNLYPNVASVHRSGDGTVTVAWSEVDTTLTTNDHFLNMRQLKSNDGTFKTIWNRKRRISSTVPSIGDNLRETEASINSDSADNIIVLYSETRNLPYNTFERRAMVAQLLPSSPTKLFQLDKPTYGGGLISDSSGDNFVFGWGANNSNRTSIFNPNQDSVPSLPHIVSSSINSSIVSGGFNGKEEGVAAFPSGQKLVVSIDVNGINYAEYDPLVAGWSTTEALESVSATFFKFYKGARDIITVVWEANSNIYIKRYKLGIGWQTITHSITATNVQNIDITTSLDGKTTIVWESFVPNTQATKSDLFAIRLE